MIDGVIRKKLTVHRDVPDRAEDAGKEGFLMEVLRDDDELLKKFGQSTFTSTPPGVIKAFHYHDLQDDLWFVASGRALIVLHDLRPDSPTFGQTDAFVNGEGNYELVLIPVGVAHGLKVIGDKPMLQFYHTTKSYNPKEPDEKRLPHDDPRISFDWTRDA